MLPTEKRRDSLHLTAIADETDNFRKIKYFVHGKMGVSTQKLNALKVREGLKVNGVCVHADYVLKTGDVVEVIMDETSERAVLPEEGEIDILFEDEDLLILNKCAPLACQCTTRQPSGTLENRLAWNYAQRGEPFIFRPLNRLDKGTSGVMAAAKNAHAYHLLQQQLHSPEFRREYLAVVEGILDGSGTIDLPIGREEDSIVKRKVDTLQGKPAITHYQVLEHGIQEGVERTLVRLVLETGRTHQIRVHMASLGHPVTGDYLYGTEHPALPDRFALHSHHLVLKHPATGKTMEFTAKCPDEFDKILSISDKIYQFL